jgi:catechol 2,3-dioxygenase-like lactoylglutathione lyase family enzyme
VSPPTSASGSAAVNHFGQVHSASPRGTTARTGRYGRRRSASGHVANSNRIAFWVESASEVDRIAEVARLAGAADMSGPKPMPYRPGYFAAFFADPSGNRLEVYVRPE